MYFFRTAATSFQFFVARFFSLWASSTITTSYASRWISSRWTSRFAVSIDEITRSWRAQSSSSSMISNERPNFVSISSCHWATREAGVRMRTFRASPRTTSSFRTIPASIVFPRPTSSARIARPRISRSTRRAVSTW